MNVQELIDALEKIEDKTKIVITEGCDCNGDAGSLDDGDEVMILRSVPLAASDSVPARSWRERFTIKELELLP